MDAHSDENMESGVKGVSGESDEVMLSDPMSGEESSPADYDYGGRDDEAAEEYAKKTTTETEYEDYMTDEGNGLTTTVPEPQVMDVQSNVVPVPTDTLPIQSPTPPEEGDEEERRQDDSPVAALPTVDLDVLAEEEVHPELSVGHSPPPTDSDGDDLGEPSASQQRGVDVDTAPVEIIAPPIAQDEEVSLKLGEGEDSTVSARGSSPSLTFDKTRQGASSSPEMFPSGGSPPMKDDLEEPSEKPMVRDRGLDVSDFAGVGKEVDLDHEVDSMKQTMESMTLESGVEEPIMEEMLPELEEEAEKQVEAPPVKVPQAVAPPLPAAPPRESAPSAKKGGLSALPPRKGLGQSQLVPKSSGASSSSSTQGTTTLPPQPPQPQTQPRARDMPVGFGGSGGLRPPRSSQPPAQQPPGPQQPPAQRAAPVLPVQPMGGQTAPRAAAANSGEGSSAPEPPEFVEARRKLLDIRLSVLRIASRLGMKPMDFAITDFMSKVDRTEQLRYRGPGMIRPQLDTLFNQAVELDQRTGPDSNLEITVTAIVLGPSGSGKTSVIRNILHPGPGLAPEFASEPTQKITVHTGRVCGVNFRLIDSPGLSVAASALRKNMNILKGVRRAVTKYKPDTVIYVDRMDLFRRELSDIPLLRLVNDMLPELLYNCVALLTRASAPPPDAGHGVNMPYIEYQRLRLDLCTQIITHAVSDMRWAGRPLGFENHPNCGVDDDGVPILPSGQTFKRHAIFQLISSHMSGQMEKVCKTRQLRQRTMEQMMMMMQPRKQLQLSALVSQLLAPKPPKKFPDEERELLTKREIRKLSTEEEQIEEEKKRRDYTRIRKVEILQEEAHPSQVPIVGASMELNPSFEHDVNQHRYCATDFVYGWSVRPIMSAQENVFEHDDGVEMFQVARDGVLRMPGHCVDGVPASMIVQAGKGKNFGNIQTDAGFSYHTSRNLVTTAGIVVHPAGQDGEVVYTPTVDVRAKITESDKLTVGGMACRLAENGSPLKGQLGLGGKVENKYKIRDGVKMTGSVGAMTMKPSSSQARDAAYGANLELKLAGGKGEYDPNFLFSGGVSGEKAVSPETMINGRLQLSAGGSGTASLRMITHDKPQTGWLMAVPLVIKGIKRLIGLGDEFV